MEPEQNQQPSRKMGRPTNTTNETMAARAQSIRSHVMMGRARKEICAIEKISEGEYRSAMKWLGKSWVDNSEAFGEFKISEQNRLIAIQRIINQVEGAEKPDAVDKAHALVKLHKLAHEIGFNVREMGLRLGMLTRETLRIQELPKVEVAFGDEKTVPWFSQEDKETPREAVN